MLEEAHISMRHPDLFRALEDLQQVRPGTQTERTDE
jgi:hypothetical protein